MPTYEENLGKALENAQFNPSAATAYAQIAIAQQLARIADVLEKKSEGGKVEELATLLQAAQKIAAKS